LLKELSQDTIMDSSPVATLGFETTDWDVELMLRTKAGDDAAFSELFERYSRRLVSFAYRIVRDRWRAEELVQDAFLQIYRARDRYTPSARFSPYIYRVVTNNCLNEVRRQDREKNIPDETTAVLADDMTRQPDHLAMDREIIARIGAIVGDLPLRQRAALLLSRVEGLDHREVGSCLGISEIAVRSLVFRAIRTLREGMEESTFGSKRSVRGSSQSKHTHLPSVTKRQNWLARSIRIACRAVSATACSSVSMARGIASRRAATR